MGAAGRWAVAERFARDAGRTPRKRVRREASAVLLLTACPLARTGCAPDETRGRAQGPSRSPDGRPAALCVAFELLGG